jgi:sporulation protein YlmC with PRC-barrel domain
MARIELECEVVCADGPFGKLADVVVDPKTRTLTHLIVEPAHGGGGGQLVPASLATVEDGARETKISLACTLAEAQKLPHVQDFLYAPVSGTTLDDPDWDIGIERAFVLPAVGPDQSDLLALDDSVSVAFDRVPKGEVEIRRDSPVVTADGHGAGHVDSFVIDGSGRITHLVLERGHLWGRRQVTIPIESVARVETDAVTLVLTKSEVARLPSVRV